MKKFFNNYLYLNVPNKINAVFCFPKQSFNLLNYIELKENVALYTNITLQRQFNDFIRSNLYVDKYKNASLFLKKDNKITKLNADKTVSQLGLKNGDIIFISYYKPKIEDPKNAKFKTSQSEIINSERKILQKKEIIPQIEQNLPKKKICLLGLIICFIIILLLIIIIPIFFLKKNSLKAHALEKEKLIIKKLYPSNRLFIFNSKQVTEMIIEGEKINKENSYHNFTKISDFIFITRAAYLEKDQNNLIEKEWYLGYIGIFDLIVPNKTHDNHIVYDQKINNYLNISKRRLNNRDEYYIKNGSNFCFIKIEFYQNGEIKNIYLPKGFLLNYYSYIEEIVKLLIPKISKNLYIESIDDKLNEFIEKNNYEKNFNNEDLNEINSQFIFDRETNLRNLNFNQKQKKHSSNFIKKRLSDDSNTNKTNNSEIAYTLEDYLTQPQTKSINFEFREVNIINDSIYNNDTDNYINNNGINQSNYSN